MGYKTESNKLTKKITHVDTDNTWYITELYTWNLYDLINQCHTNYFNLKKNENKWNRDQKNNKRKTMKPRVSLSKHKIDKFTTNFTKKKRDK